jgi:hypothetical protein
MSPEPRARSAAASGSEPGSIHLELTILELQKKIAELGTWNDAFMPREEWGGGGGAREYPGAAEAVLKSHPPAARRTQGAQHRDTECAAWWSIKTSTPKMTDHVAEQIEMKFKAATVSQPPTKLVWPISTISTALAVRNGSESSRCGRSLCTSVTHLRGCTWQPIFRVFEVLKAVIY